MLVRSCIMISMSRLSLRKRAEILRLLVDGNSIGTTYRNMGVSRNTVTKLLCDVGSACLDYQDEVLRDLPGTRIECKPIWSFGYAKQKRTPGEKQGESGFGDVGTWTSVCLETQVVPCWHIGRRNAADAQLFMNDVTSRLHSPIQPVPKELQTLLEAVEVADGSDPSNGCTNHVERQNLSMRGNVLSFTQPRNAFSRKVENYAHAISTHFMYYNFARVHQSPGVTPAMKAGVASHIWDIEEIATLGD